MMLNAKDAKEIARKFLPDATQNAIEKLDQKISELAHQGYTSAYVSYDYLMPYRNSEIEKSIMCALQRAGYDVATTDSLGTREFIIRWN